LLWGGDAMHDDFSQMVFKWFWLAAVLTSFLNAGVFWKRAKQNIDIFPELEEGYRKIIKGFLFWSNLPWVVMGVGIIFGGVPSFFHFLHPRDGNPFVLAFIASILCIYAAGTYWLFSRNGIETLIRHNAMFAGAFDSPAKVKLQWFGSLVGGLLLITIMFLVDFPLPPFAK
jgi:hypothetical protein